MSIFEWTPFQGTCHDVFFAQALENKEPRAATVKVTSTTAKTQLGRSSVFVEVASGGCAIYPTKKKRWEFMILLPLKG